MGAVNNRVGHNADSRERFHELYHQWVWSGLNEVASSNESILSSQREPVVRCETNKGL